MNHNPVVWQNDGPHTVNHIDVVECKDKGDKVSFVMGMFTLTALVIIAVVVIAALVRVLS